MVSAFISATVAKASSLVDLNDYTPGSFSDGEKGSQHLFLNVAFLQLEWPGLLQARFPFDLTPLIHKRSDNFNPAEIHPGGHCLGIRVDHNLAVEIDDIHCLAGGAVL